jgi:hypothetical protein
LAKAVQSLLPLAAALLIGATVPPALAYQIDVEHGCGEKHPIAALAEGNCQDFDVHAGFATSAAILDAKIACLEFFRKSWEANNLLCSFIKDVQVVQNIESAIQALQNPGHTTSHCSLEEKNGGLENELDLRDHKLRAAYLERIRKLHEEVKNSAENYQHKISRVRSEGLFRTFTEMNCTFNRNSEKASLAPGVLESGLAAKAGSDMSVASNIILTHLRKTGLGLTAAHSEGKVPSRHIELPKEKLDFDNMGKIDIETIPDEEDESLSGLASAMSTMVGNYGETAADKALGRLGARFTTHERLNGRKMNFLLRHFPVAGALSALGSASIDYGSTGHLGVSDLVSYGVQVFSYDASLAVSAISDINDQVQDVKRKYSQFAGSFLEAHPDATSAEMARAWGKAKYQESYQHKHPEPKEFDIEVAWEPEKKKLKEQVITSYLKKHKHATREELTKEWVEKQKDAKEKFAKDYKKKILVARAAAIDKSYEEEIDVPHDVFIQKFKERHPDALAYLTEHKDIRAFLEAHEKIKDIAGIGGDKLREMAAEATWSWDRRYRCEVKDPPGAPERKPGWNKTKAKGDSDDDDDVDDDDDSSTGKGDSSKAKAKKGKK